MIRNFFLIAVRNISKHFGFTLINITGLSVGLASSLLLLLWVRDELSYEKFNLNAENIYRVEEDQFYSGRRYHVTVTPYPSGPVWKEKIPEIKEQSRISRMPRLLFRMDDKVFFESSVVAADSGLLKMFTMPLVKGDPQTALEAPHSIILTEKLAAKYFGKTDPLGKSVTLENRYQFMVTGVMKDLPKNSMFTFEGILPFSFLKELGAYSEHWGSNSIFTFVQVENSVNIDSINKKLTGIVLENLPETTTKFSLFPMMDIHLHGQFGFIETRGPVIVVYVFTLIAIFILLIACINFINLSTAKASSRGKEIGIKKVAGADKKSLIIHFMLESLLMVIIAMVFAFALVGISLDLFNNISGKYFTLPDLVQPGFLLCFLTAGLVAGFISGVYPAFYLSSFNPVNVLKGETVTGGGNGRLRRILVIIQFSLSILIAIAAVFMYRQLKFMQEKELGFDKNNVIGIQMADNMKPKYYSLKLELKKESLIRGVTASLWNPVMIGSNSGGAEWDGKEPDRHVLIGTNGVDYDYVSTMKMEIVSGRDFSRDFPADLARDTTGNFLVNEEVVKLMEIGDPVGKRFRFMGLSGTIVGVMKNFHFKGADQPIEPVAFALADTGFLRMILIRLAPGDVPAALKTVERIWKDVLPEYPLEYSFIDQDYNNLFRSQIRLTRLLKYFTILAIFIACLGLYGLASYSAERRTNEIGIRKVMGAGSLEVIYSMIMEFLVPVLISVMISLPLGWIIVDKLLKQFAYRIDKSMFVFAGIAIGAVIIAVFTVSYQAYKATGINPAEALKLE
jgi:ABC-type antimicrobial peptide transport system permease subunit